jgi:cytochrome c-type biogenesis protein CcmH/NrfG
VIGTMEDLGDPLRRDIQHHIKRAMQLDGDNPTVIAWLVTAYAGLGDAAACLRLGRRAVELNPDVPHAQSALGFACWMTGLTADAIAAFRKLERIAPNDTEFGAFAMLMLGVCLCVEDEPAEAEAALDRSLALNPDNNQPLMWKAIAAAQQGNEQVARDAIMRLREAEPGISLDQHVHLMLFNPGLRDRLTGAVAILRGLWDATGGDA